MARQSLKRRSRRRRAYFVLPTAVGFRRNRAVRLVQARTTGWRLNSDAWKSTLEQGAAHFGQSKAVVLWPMRVISVVRPACASVVLFIIGLMILSACGRPKNEDTLSCGSLDRSFFNRLNHQDELASFRRFNREAQFQIFTCGMQHREPPQIELASEFASEGVDIVPFLSTKLRQSTDDLTTRDVVTVFFFMSSNRTYDVRGNSELMRLLTEKVGSMRSPSSKRACENMIQRITDRQNPA